MKSDINVFIISRESRCSECGEELERNSWITLDKEKGALCLSCADMDHLWFLPSGDAAMTRRAKKHSGLTAVVLKWAKARKRYERQGLLVEQSALEKAEKECLADSEQRERRKQREALKKADIDRQFLKNFAKKIKEYYPNCPPGRENTIAAHACLKYSGRIGRSQAAKDFSRDAIKLAIIAHIRHTETNYDELLMQGFDRYNARAVVDEKVFAILERWS